MSALPSTPMLDKMRAVRERSQLIGEFLEWLEGKGYILCCRTQGEEMRFPYLPARKSIEELLAEFFEVDLDAAEREQRAVLEWVRQRG
ncbi:MAG: hypothetical protein AB1609_22745 [Bacillota bacterium]